MTILDDAYNANPQSMRAALEVLSQTDGAYRVAVLGNMFELGIWARSSTGAWGVRCQAGEHRRPAGRRRPGLEYLRRGPASGSANVYYAKDRVEAEAILPQFIRPDAVILVKASRGMAFEELTRELRQLTRKT